MITSTAAHTARERLLSDRVMRRNKSPGSDDSTSDTTPLSQTQTAAPAVKPLLPLPEGDPLPRAEQEQRAVQVALGFRRYYLAETYWDESGIAVALVKPIFSGKRRADTPHKICVDADGNVSVLPVELDDQDDQLAGPGARWPLITAASFLIGLGILLAFWLV
jgi:hypothetical protein